MHHNPAPDAKQHCCEHFKPVSSAAQACSSLIFLDSHSPRRERICSLFERHVDPHIELIGRLHKRHTPLQITASVETGRPPEADLRNSKLTDTVETKRAHVFAGQAMADQVPAPVDMQ